ncbi:MULTISPECIES: hypothetical protein [Mycobacterium]|uniref:Uncharacterized protein n=1 Tax=Mycobacterium kiyosense TaxID=2871094 RepID=A0A9P3Q376_9MYCO|nr:MULTISPECIES: hypothetical protein [Mycobacterium]BDB41852.1 hypothetical protein IWGMT90018_22980 [Mycobacterium kiyosense]BDE14855.1 hypothetical protein MKCMC460_37150 [Mycobacterium sp. 20KCMC460]GLB82229.1 hypothetical protein SRL2020028_14850 [Mycobacterium kiyosense]GLB89279.1 hypothetical protein SRL2020130_20960 [Mycobacterium kiyosense]GLB95933.1 hypothetical protein SRL2020226_27090 [Mycobacterium kiyosense]
MNTTHVQPRTYAFARVLGPFLAILGTATVARGSEMRALLDGFESNPAWAWMSGTIVLLIGIVIVALHPYWRGAPAATVSALGWMLTARGLLLVAFPGVFMKAADATIGMSSAWMSASILVAAAGAYLTYVGWRPAPAQPVRSDATSRDLPSAA